MPTRKRLDYKWIVKGVKGRWQVRTTQMKNKPEYLFLGSFTSSEEAAKMADKLMFIYDDIPIEKLNFPELLKDLNKESLKSSLEAYFQIFKPKLNSQKTIGTFKSGNLWSTYINYKSFTYYLTCSSKSREEAHFSLKDYLEEILKETPNIDNMIHLKLAKSGEYFLKNKDTLDVELILKMRKLYEYIISV